MACSVQGEAQQSGMWTGVSRSAAKEGGTERDMRRIFKMLREV